jgi:prolipoprotein diacylglyceryltransferase
VKNFLRRLFRFVNDPRYGLCYSPTPEAYKKAWESVVGDSLKQPFSLIRDPMPGDRPSFKTAFRELRPPLEWPDFLGNGLFVLFCVWVLTRAIMSPEGFWIFLLTLLVIAMGLVRLFVEVCRLAWRAWLSHHNGC